MKVLLFVLLSFNGLSFADDCVFLERVRGQQIFVCEFPKDRCYMVYGTSVSMTCIPKKQEIDISNFDVDAFLAEPTPAKKKAE